MANLVTHHDPFHIHKILGVLAVLNFAVRMFMSLYGGKSYVTLNDYYHGNCSWNRLIFDCTCIVMHGFLSWSSLLLPLPKKRNLSAPMIWSEFRWHSIIFATRHVVGALLSMWGLWPTKVAWNYISKLALVLATCYSADYITAEYGCTTKRTTNSMPYPPNITTELQKGIKMNYAQAQFLAALSVTSENCDAAFWPLLGIQSAPFVMTLRRKGLGSALLGHRVYATCLVLPMLPSLVGALFHGYLLECDQMVAVFLIHTIPYELRVRFGQSKFVTWSIGMALGIAACKGPFLSYVSLFHQTLQGKLVSTVIGSTMAWCKYRYFYPLLDLKNSSKVVPRAPHDVFIDWINSQFKLNINTKSLFWGPDKMLKYH